MERICARHKVVVGQQATLGAIAREVAVPQSQQAEQRALVDRTALTALRRLLLWIVAGGFVLAAWWSALHRVRVISAETPEYNLVGGSPLPPFSLLSLLSSAAPLVVGDCINDGRIYARELRCVKAVLAH
jgi:hypothetical protein